MPMRLRIDAGCQLAAGTPLASVFLALQDSMREVQQLVDTMQSGEMSAVSADIVSMPLAAAFPALPPSSRPESRFRCSWWTTTNCWPGAG